MDKKLYPNLDPKLKEVYDRVMGLGLPARPASPPPQAPLTKKSQPVSFVANVDVKTPEVKKSSSVSLIAVIVVATIFFLVYGLFWIKLFNIRLPFTLPF